MLGTLLGWQPGGLGLEFSKDQRYNLELNKGQRRFCVNILIILGTAREGRYSDKVAGFVSSVLKAEQIVNEIIDVRDYRLAASDNSEESLQAKKLAEKVVKADALIIVMPEYNHGYPGELKMMFDLLYGQYNGKVIGLCGVSKGPLGGARGLQALKLTLASVGAVPVIENVYFSNVQQLFDEKGVIKDPAYESRVKGLLKGISARLKR